jgi:hypothetical protein
VPGRQKLWLQSDTQDRATHPSSWAKLVALTQVRLGCTCVSAWHRERNLAQHTVHQLAMPSSVMSRMAGGVLGRQGAWQP